nr:angiotensin-converting enzyme [Haliclona caerulea]
MLRCLFLVFVALLLETTAAAFDQAEENKTLAFLKWYNDRAAKEEYIVNEATWKHATNLTAENQALKTEASVAFSIFMQNARKNASKFDRSKLSDDSKRQITRIIASASPKDKDDLKKLSDLESRMEDIYSSSKVQDSDGKMLALDPDLTKIMSTSRDYERLKFAWKGWRNATGPKIRPIYKTFVELSNKGAKEHGWKDTGEWWRSWYEVDNLEEIVEGLYADLKPLYEELHAYVRFKLSKKYKQVEKTGPIPAHLLGNMWSQSWVNIYDLVEPYQGEPSLDVTPNMVKQNYTPLKMVKLAEEFFTSIGLKALPPSFYSKSLIEKPSDREVICHASAWDFSINKDVRIKQCTTVTHNYLVTTHHELGHIQYYLQYWDQAYEYRTGANPGFHEAVGDTLSLSVDTPQHLKKIGLLETVGTSNKSDINALMKMALRKIAFLPFGFLIDQWRWNVFNGKISSDQYNKKWWELRTKYQGIKPPVSRSEDDFDPGAKYHIPGNTPYIRYFVSTVLQFQFHKAACEAAGVKGPLHQCSIYNSTAAGKKMGDMLAMGKSKPWPEALAKMTGTKTMDVGALKEYFQPLNNWLVEQRKKEGYEKGWDTAVSSSVTFGPAVVTIISSLLATLAYLM